LQPPIQGAAPAPPVAAVHAAVQLKDVAKHAPAHILFPKRNALEYDTTIMRTITITNIFLFEIISLSETLIRSNRLCDLKFKMFDMSFVGFTLKK
jgi:hypothetical protein